MGIIAWTVFVTGILYYCYAYLLRVYPSIIEAELVQHFAITAGGLGMLTSFYYFAYAPMQVPVGLTVDRLGVKRSLLFACAIATTGTVLFAQTDVYQVALLGRFFIGFGAAFAYVTALKIATVWLPKRYFATATGFVTGSGMTAAIITDLALTRVSESHSFQTAAMIPTYVGLVLFVLILIFIRDKKASGDTTQEEASAVSFGQLWEYVVLIVKNPQMWLIGFVGAILYLPATVFIDLWGIPYLKNVHGFTKHQAATGISVMLAGWLISSFMTGIISDMIHNRKLPLLIGGILSVIVSLVLLYVPDLTPTTIYILLFWFGVSCGPHPLCFTLSKESYDSKVAGTAVSFANFIIMMGGFVFQPFIGKLLDIFASANSVDGILIYSPEQYTHALSVLPIGLTLGVIVVLFIRDTGKKVFDE